MAANRNIVNCLLRNCADISDYNQGTGECLFEPVNYKNFIAMKAGNMVLDGRFEEENIPPVPIADAEGYLPLFDHISKAASIHPLST